jgi:hypothetical protein
VPPRVAQWEKGIGDRTFTRDCVRKRRCGDETSSASGGGSVGNHEGRRGGAGTGDAAGGSCTGRCGVAPELGPTVCARCSPESGPPTPRCLPKLGLSIRAMLPTPHCATHRSRGCLRHVAHPSRGQVSRPRRPHHAARPASCHPQELRSRSLEPPPHCRQALAPPSHHATGAGSVPPSRWIKRVREGGR